MLQTIFFQFAIEGRASDPELAGDRRHLTAIIIERETQGFGFQLIEAPQAAAVVEQPQNVRVVNFDTDNFTLRLLLACAGARRSRNAHIEAADLRGDLRKFGDRQLIAVGKHHGAKDGIFELADIARPFVTFDKRQRLGADAAQTLAFLGGETGGETAGEISDVAAPNPERRDCDRKDIQPVIEIFAEGAAKISITGSMSFRSLSHLCGTRRSDIADLARRFTARFAAEEGKRLRGIAAEALALIESYDWPGNVRQLENAIFRAVVLADGDELTITEFPQIAAQVSGFDVRIPAAPCVSARL